MPRLSFCSTFVKMQQCSDLSVVSRVVQHHKAVEKHCGVMAAAGCRTPSCCKQILRQCEKSESVVTWSYGSCRCDI